MRMAALFPNVVCLCVTRNAFSRADEFGRAGCSRHVSQQILFANASQVLLIRFERKFVVRFLRAEFDESEVLPFAANQFYLSDEMAAVTGRNQSCGSNFGKFLRRVALQA